MIVKIESTRKTWEATILWVVTRGLPQRSYVWVVGRTGRRVVLSLVGRHVAGEVVSEPVLLDSAKMGGNPVLYHLCLVIIIAHESKILISGCIVKHFEKSSRRKALGFAPSLEALMPFAGDSLPQIKALLESSFSETLLLPLNGEQRNKIADILLKYIGYHSESTLNIQSLEVLREIFA